MLAVNFAADAVGADADADLPLQLQLFASVDAADTFTAADADIAATHAVLLPLLLVLLVLLQRKWKFQLFSTFSRWQSRHGAQLVFGTISDPANDAGTRLYVIEKNSNYLLQFLAV